MQTAGPPITADSAHRPPQAAAPNQALSALLFLYRYVLERQLGELGTVIRAKKSSRLPVVLTDPEDFSFSICDLSFVIGENNPPPVDKEYR